MIFTSNLLDFIVTVEVKTWTQGIMRTKRNESNRSITEGVLLSESLLVLSSYTY